MKVLLINIQELLQVHDQAPPKVSGLEMQYLPKLKNAWLLLNKGLIEDYGTMDQRPKGNFSRIIDCTGRIVMPTWCDSHTHLVYAGNRAQEFIDRIKGLSYQEIAERGGGILNSAQRLQQTSERSLFEQSFQHLEEVVSMGTGAIEIKSGYGLTVESELKMLRVARKLANRYPVAIKTTFLGAHAVPAEFKGNREHYLDQVCNEMLPRIAEENLADYIDIFCEDGYFSVEDTERVLSEGKKYGLVPKIHVNQFKSIGGIAAGVKYKALSVDHLEVLTQADLDALKGSETMPVALPACSFFLGIPYTPGRQLIDSGLPMALASDYNPGSSPTGNMNFVVAAACIKMKLTPEEAINAATLNGAYAMGLSDTLGTITRGKIANVMITKEIPSYGYLPYSFGNMNIDQVILKGRVL
ncbi:MAG: imidazolonepropionase [Flavobacteriaceae bacterium]